MFWRKGYDGAPVKNLTDAMGINSLSLYAVFGNKYQFYLEAIKQYTASEHRSTMLAFEPDIELAVASFFKTVIE